MLIKFNIIIFQSFLVLFFENIFIKNIKIKNKSKIGIKIVSARPRKMTIKRSFSKKSMLISTIKKLKIGVNSKNKSAIEIYLKILSILFILLFYQNLSLIVMKFNKRFTFKQLHSKNFLSVTRHVYQTIK